MKKLFGVTALLAATVLYGLVAVYARMIGTDFGIFMQAAIRDGFVFIAMGAVVFGFRLWKQVKREHWKWILLWVLVDTFSSIGIFVSFNRAQIGITYFVFYVGIIISGFLFGVFLYQEKMSIAKWISFLCSAIGLAFIFSIGQHVEITIWEGLAFLSGAGIGLWNILSKKFSHAYAEIQLVFLNALFACVFALSAAILDGEHIPVFAMNVHWLGIGLYAASQLFTIFLVVYGFKHLEAHEGTLVMPFEVVWGALFGFLFFRELLSSTVLFGGFLILLSAVLPSLLSMSESKKAA